MGFEPTTLCDLVRCSNHTNVGLLLKPHHMVTQPNDDFAHMNSLTALYSHIEASSKVSLP